MEINVLPFIEPIAVSVKVCQNHRGYQLILFNLSAGKTKENELLRAVITATEPFRIQAPVSVITLQVNGKIIEEFYVFRENLEAFLNALDGLYEQFKG